MCSYKSSQPRFGNQSILSIQTSPKKIMFTQIIGIVVLVAIATAQHHHSASSYISFSQNTGHSGGLGQEGLSSFSGGLGSAGSSHNQGGSSYITYSHGQSDLGGSSSSLGSSASHAAPVHIEEHHAPAKYQFKYGVEDKHTGDIKQHEETRNGDVVKGSYSLHEPDGTILIVHYTADKHSGFNAVVQRQGHASHPQHSHH